MEKQFVPYELAVKLKELGFDEPCFGCYLDDKYLCKELTERQDYFAGQEASAPLWQQAFEFFRERGYNLITNIKPSVGSIPKSYLAHMHHDSYTTELLPSCGSRSFEGTQRVILELLIEFESKLKYSITAVYKIED